MTDAGNDSAKRVAAVIFNPIKTSRSRLQIISRVAARNGWAEPLWFETTPEEAGGGLTRQALEAGADVVIAAGGDGTGRAVAAALLDTGVPLGLLPVGTGNLLARNLHLPIMSLEAAAKTIFTGTDRKIDVGLAEITRSQNAEPEQSIFLVMAGLGLDAAMIAKTNPELKKRMGWLAYIAGGLHAASKSTRVSLYYRLDGGEEKHLTTHSLVVGNCGLLPANVLLLPEAVIDDGVLDIVAMRPQGFLGWLRAVYTVVWENGVLRRSEVGRKFIGSDKEVRTLLYMKGAELGVRSNEPIPFEIDGEEEGEALEVSISVDPLALTVRVAK